MHITQVCESEDNVSHQSLPVLFVSDVVVLPGMVVSIELDESSQAAIDAARASSDGRLLVAPRLEDRYAAYGVIASVEQVGRFRGGSPAAVLKADRRARIGSGVSGPGAALWVDTETMDDPVSDRARELAEEYKRLVVAVLQRIRRRVRLRVAIKNHGVGDRWKRAVQSDDMRLVGRNGERDGAQVCIAVRIQNGLSQ